MPGTVEGRDSWLRREETERERGAHREPHKENTSPNPLTWKMRETNFCEYFPLAGLKNLS